MEASAPPILLRFARGNADANFLPYMSPSAQNGESDGGLRSLAMLAAMRRASSRVSSSAVARPLRALGGHIVLQVGTQAEGARPFKVGQAPAGAP